MAQQRRLTVLCYNVFNGFQRGKSYRATVKWLRSVKPDLAGWQELVGWDEARLRKCAADWRHPHAVTLKGGGYNIGLTSRTPIEVVDRHTRGFWHGYLHGRAAGIDVIVCHLWPGTRRGQLREARQLRDLVVRLASEKRPVILMGDFNAHSRRDKAWLDRQLPLIERRGPGDAKKKPKDRFLRGGKFTFDVMDTIFEAPLRDLVSDAFRARQPKAAYRDLLQLGSFPTRVLQHVRTPTLQRGFLERIDFVLATPDLAVRCSQAKVCRDAKVLETTSDHYPVVASFGLGGK